MINFDSMKYNSILVIDDSKLDRFIASEILEDYVEVKEIVGVESAEKGLEYLQSIEEQPQNLPEIILLDIKMPKMDGFDFLQIFDRFPETIKNNCKIFMLSSSIDPDDIRKAQKSKYVVDFIEKPLSEENINRINSFF